MNEIFSPPPGNDDDDDVINNLYESTVQQASVRFRNVTGSIRTPSRSNVANTGQYDIPWLRMDAFIRKRKVKKSLDRVYMLIGAIGIFYGLPTVQLLYTYHQISESTGQTDLCYRNYLCSHRVYSWDDFNHIYSNIVYVLLAVVFCIFVRRYEKKVHRLEVKLQEQGISEGDIGEGVGHQFGIFYALGLAFGLEGILSGLYHVCPTEMNFQFDTSFMFILAALSTIKIYQFRHTNPICPHNTFGMLALISFISVGGIILGSKIYEGIFIFLHVVMILLLSVYLYYLGYVRDDDNNPVTDNNNPVTDSAIFRKSEVLKKFRNDPFVLFKPDHGTRLTFLLPLIVFNLAISISQILGQNPFPTYLVYIFAGNMMLYFLYYCVMKVYHGEAFNIQFIQPLIYLIFSFALGALGILYFLDKKYNANLSPAESRALNSPCIIESFYDSHDVWHFLSAGSIFFFFMTLLTLDDGIIQKPRQEIVAF
ncbi:unnamed protein product [Allacma fusca]|uniref:Uncharacterized protein n=2 Tax=Allacma fusca TaxID=39272 RepID=A0A8J2Q1I1_9HEXA|nr:unnamed protein product [Allacma fusca]